MADAYLGVRSGVGGFNKLYVLKVLRSDVDERDRADLLSMFQDEGRLAALLNHQHIVQSHEMGCDDGHDFIAMDYLEGQPLSVLQERWTDDADCFPLGMRLFVIGQLLDGLDYAHNLVDYEGKHLRIVHRDVSPQNVFVTYDGTTKLLDFGIAKTQRSKETRAGIVKGKIQYMAPEQVRRTELDARADLFSVGVVLWECIANRPFHTDQTEYDILKRLAEGDLPRLRDVVSDVPPLLERIVSRALAFEPKDRYPDARSFREELLCFPGVRDVTTQDVAQRMRTLFAENRKAIAETIREAMSPEPLRDPETATQTVLPFLPTAHVHKRDPISTAAPTTAVVAAPSVAASTAPPLAAPADHSASSPHGPSTQDPFTKDRSVKDSSTQDPSTKHRVSLRSWLVVSAGAAVAATALALVSSQKPPLQSNLGASVPASALQPSVAPPLLTPSAPIVIAPPPNPVPVASAPVPATIQLSLAIKPNTATIFLDGQRVTQNPLRESRPRDGSTHTLKLSAPGYQDKSLSLVFDADIVREVELIRSPSKPPRAEPEWVNDKLPPRPQSSPQSNPKR